MRHHFKRNELSLSFQYTWAHTSQCTHTGNTVLTEIYWHMFTATMFTPFY
jgi:hypothetical protein